MSNALQPRKTERDQSIERVTESEERYRTLVRASSAIVWLADAVGRTKYNHAQWEAFTGQGFADQQGDGHFNVVHPDDAPRVRALWADAVAYKRPYEGEMRLWHAPSSEYHHVISRGVPRLDASGRIIEWVGTITDVHEHRRAERILRQLADVDLAMSRPVSERGRLTRLAQSLVPSLADWCAAGVVEVVDGRHVLRLEHSTHANPGEAEAMVMASPEGLTLDIDSTAEQLTCLRTGQPQRITASELDSTAMTGVAQGPQHTSQIAELRRLGLREVLFVPLTIRGGVVALLTLGLMNTGRRFDERDCALAAEIARRASLPLENQRLYEQEVSTRQRAEGNADYLTRQQALTAALTAGLTQQQVCDAILDAATQAFGSSTSGISLLDDVGDALHLMCSRGYPEDVTRSFVRMPLTRSVASVEVVKTCQPLWFETQEAYLSRYPALREIFARQNDHACAVVPLVLAGAPIGAIALNFNAPRQFSEQDRALLTTFAAQGAQALERARLFEREAESRHEAERNADYLARLQGLTAALSSAVTREQVVQAIVDETAAGMDAMTASLALVMEDERTLELFDAIGWQEEMKREWQYTALDEALPGSETVRTGRPVWVESAAELARRYPDMAKAYAETHQQAFAAVPMALEDRVLGVLMLGFDAAGPFSGEEKDLLLTAASQGALALERARLYQDELETRRRAERDAMYLSRLQQLTVALSAPLTRAEIAQAIIEAAMTVLGAEAGAVALLSDDGQFVDLVSPIGYPKDVIEPLMRTSFEANNLPNVVLRTGEPAWIESMAEVARHFPETTGKFAEAGYGASAFVPMKLGGKVIGLIGFDFRQPRAFSVEEKGMFTNYAAQCAQALERARYYEDSMRMNVMLEERVAARTRQLQEANAELSESRQRLRDLSGQILAAVEDERTRIAREVHDELGQSLTVMRIELGRARLVLKDISDAGVDVDGTEDSTPSKAVEASGRIKSAIAQVDFTLRSMRRLATELRPVILDDLGLEAAVEWQVQEFQSHAGIVCSLETVSDGARIDADVSIAVFRILQEALANVAKHAQASSVQVILCTDSRRLLLRVCDDGTGLANSGVRGQKSAGQRGFGVLGMQERAARVGGRVKIAGKAGRGTAVTLIVPSRNVIPEPTPASAHRVGVRGGLEPESRFSLLRR